jgi:hypothetical protein
MKWSSEFVATGRLTAAAASATRSDVPRPIAGSVSERRPRQTVFEPKE